MVGASQAAGSRWFRERGGLPTFWLLRSPAGICRSKSGRRSRCCGAQGLGVRAVARRLGRDPSTVSRELRRNAASRGGKLDYRASVAQWRRSCWPGDPSRPRWSPTSGCAITSKSGWPGRSSARTAAWRWGRWCRRGRVGTSRYGDRRWATAWSPEQISTRLRVDFPDDDSSESRTRRSTRRSTSKAGAR